MDNFITKMENIMQIVSIIDEKSKYDFLKNNQENLVVLDNILSEMENSLLNCKISNAKFRALQQKYKHDNIVMKRIFPHYWAAVNDIEPIN